MIPCIHQAPALSPGKIICHSNRVSVQAPSLQRAVACQACPYQNLPNLDTPPAPNIPDDILPEGIPEDFIVDGPCPYRGIKIRDDKCNLCGLRSQTFEVLDCSIYGECSLRPSHSNIRNCLACMVRGENKQPE